MSGTSRKWRRLRIAIVTGLAVPGLLSVAENWTAMQRLHAATPPTTAVASAPAQVFDLATCRSVALEQQPALAAYRASLSAAQARSRSLDNLLVPTILKRDLPIRRKQAALSVVISQAGVDQAEWETLYAVTRTYLAAVYAHEQQEVADKALDNLKQLNEATQRLLDAAAGNVTTRDLEKAAVYIPLARGRREEATQGAHRALVGLREAMGLDADATIQVSATHMPSINVEVNREEIINLALTRRGELTQAANAAALTCQEINAQKTSFFKGTAPTFASAGDIHARQVPQGISNGEYRPGAIALEMPTTLVGTRNGRLDQAHAFNSRAQAVVDKTRNLITLEAEDSYLKWVESSRKVVEFAAAADAAEKLARSLREDLEKQRAKVTVDEVLSAGVLATGLRVQANEARFNQLLALAALERVTAGGFNLGFDAVPAKP